MSSNVQHNCPRETPWQIRHFSYVIVQKFNLQCVGHTFITNQVDVYQRYCLSYSKFLSLASTTTISSPHDNSHAAESKSKHTPFHRLIPFIAANINLKYAFAVWCFIVLAEVVYVVVVWSVVNTSKERAHPHTNIGLVK
jgi:hypothetical protein